jgi:hypothetical protein
VGTGSRLDVAIRANELKQGRLASGGFLSARGFLAATAYHTPDAAVVEEQFGYCVVSGAAPGASHSARCALSFG